MTVIQSHTHKKTKKNINLICQIAGGGGLSPQRTLINLIKRKTASIFSHLTVRLLVIGWILIYCPLHLIWWCKTLVSFLFWHHRGLTSMCSSLLTPFQSDSRVYVRNKEKTKEGNLVDCGAATTVADRTLLNARKQRDSDCKIPPDLDCESRLL